MLPTLFRRLPCGILLFVFFSGFDPRLNSFLLRVRVVLWVEGLCPSQNFPLSRVLNRISGLVKVYKYKCGRTEVGEVLLRTGEAFPSTSGQALSLSSCSTKWICTSQVSSLTSPRPVFPSFPALFSWASLDQLSRPRISCRDHLSAVATAFPALGLEGWDTLLGANSSCLTEYISHPSRSFKLHGKYILHIVLRIAEFEFPPDLR